MNRLSALKFSLPTLGSVDLALVVVVLLAALFLLLLVVGVIMLLRRRRSEPAAHILEDRRWRKAFAAEQRAAERIPRRLRAAARRWLVLGAPGHGKSHLLARLGAEPRRQTRPDLPRWWNAGRLRYLEMPATPEGAKETAERAQWRLRYLARSGDRGLPLHGVLVVVDVMALREDPTTTLAGVDRIAGQISAITGHDVELPIVVALTHIDRLPGATEAGAQSDLASDLVSLAEPSTGEGSRALADTLEDDLKARRARIMEALLSTDDARRSPTHAAAWLRFHRALGELKPELRALLHRLVPTQGRALESAAGLRALSLTGAALTGGSQPLLGGYLPLLTDRASATAALRRKSQLRQGLVATLGFAAALALYHQGIALQRSHRSTIDATLTLLEDKRVGDSLAPWTAEHIGDLSRRWRASQWTMAAGQALALTLDRYLDASILKSFIEPSTATLHRRIHTLTRSGLGDEGLGQREYTALRNALEDYLRLTARRTDHACAAPPSDRALMVDDPSAVLDLLERRPWPMDDPPKRDEPLVRRARQTLGSVDSGRIIEWIAADIESSGTTPPLLARQLSSNHLFVPRDLTMAGIYTRRSWPLVQGEIRRQSEHARCWSEDAEAFESALATHYARRYRNAWLSFTDELAIRRPQDLVDGHHILDSLLDPANAPLSAYQALLKEHTQGLAASETTMSTLQSRLAATLGSAKVRPTTDGAELIARSFQPLAEYAGLADYYDHLTALRRQLDAVADDPRAAAELSNATRAAIADIRESILTASADRRTRTQLRNLLLPPLEALLGHIADDTGGHLRDAFCERISRPMRELLDGRYPWSPGAQAEIPLRDLDHFLHPRDGLLISFLTEELEPWLVLEGSRLTPRAKGRGAQLTLSPEVQSFFQAALAASDALYVDDELRVDLSLTLSCTPQIHRIGLSLGDQNLHYTCAGESERRVHWPSQGDRQGAWIEAHGRGGVVERRRRRGEWGLWRLLEETAEIVQRGASIEARIKLHETSLGELPLILRPVASHRPLFAKEQLLAPLRNPALRPPLRLFDGQGRCTDVR